MIATLYQNWTIGDICKGFQYNEYEGKGLYGLSGRLTIQPEFQRHYLYAENGGKKEIDVIQSVKKWISTRTYLFFKSWRRKI